MYCPMGRPPSLALTPPPVTAPSEPAGATPFAELAVAIDRERRRGRGAQSNDSGRFQTQARVPFDDGWQSLDDLPVFNTTRGLDTSRQGLTPNHSPAHGFHPPIHPHRRVP